MRTSPAQEIQALTVKIIGKSFSSAPEGLQEAVQLLHWIVDSARFSSRHSKETASGWGALQSYESTLGLSFWELEASIMLQHLFWPVFPGCLPAWVSALLFFGKQPWNLLKKSLDFFLQVRRSGLLYQANCWPNREMQIGADFEVGVTILTLSWELAC